MINEEQKNNFPALKGYRVVIKKCCLILDKTLKGTRGVRPDNQKVLCVPGPRTKYFECLFYRSTRYIKQ